MTTAIYKVSFYMDNTYEVLEWKTYISDEGGEGSWESVYQGSLADCEAYIRLHEGGYM